MKLAMVAQPFDVIPPGQGASISIWIDEVASRLATKHELTVYCQKVGERQQDDHSGPVRNARVSTGLDRGVIRNVRRLERLLRRDPNELFYRHYYFGESYYRFYARAVARRIREDRPDVVLIHNFSQFAAPIRRLNPDTRIVLHMHCDWLIELDRSVVQRRLDRVDAVCGCSDYIADGVARRFPAFAERCHGIHNGCHVDRFVGGNAAPVDQALRRKLDLEGKTVVTFVGRLAPEKGPHVLIDAMKRVIRERPDTVLLVIGGATAQPPSPLWVRARDEEFREVEEMKPGYRELLASSSEEIADNVRFLGNVPHPELPAYYGLTDLFVHPAVWNEPFGMILTEAMACELPVVSTHSGGVPEIIEDGETGLLARRGDADSLADAILALVVDPDRRRRMGKRGRERVEACFSWESTADRLAGVLDGVTRR